MTHLKRVADEFDHLLEHRRASQQSAATNDEIARLARKHGPKVLFELAKMHNSCPEVGRRLSK